MNIQEAFSSLLYQVASIVRKMSDEDLKDLMAGDFMVDLIRKGEGKRGHSGRTRKPVIGEEAVESVVSQLRTASEREIGFKLLAKFELSKPSLERIARHIDIPITRQDNMETLREKIIEATIGYRLRSRAIQGKSNTVSPTNRDFDGT